MCGFKCKEAQRVVPLLGATDKGLQLYSNETSATRVTHKKDGNVGIGVNNPTSRLEVKDSTTGTGSPQYGYQGATITLAQSSDTDGNTAGYVFEGAVGSAYMGGMYMEFKDHSAYKSKLHWAIRNASAFGSKMTLDEDGKVGIGNTNPSTILSLGGSLATGGIHINSGVDEDHTIIDMTGITGGGKLIWDDSEEAFSMSKGLRVTAGNVGIGTATPGSKLQVTGGDISFGTRMDSATRYIGKGQSAGGSFGGNSNWIGFASDAADDWITFGVHESGVGGGEAMRINYDKKVGIGTTNPGSLLDVNGTANIVGALTGAGATFTGDVEIGAAKAYKFTGSTAAISQSSTNDLNLYASDDINIKTRWARFYNGATEHGRIAYNGSWVTGNFYPLTNGVGDLGKTDRRWNNVYSEAGNFSGNLTVGPSNNSKIYMGGNDYIGFTDAVGDGFKFVYDNSEKLRITNVGKVGIGTTAPVAALDVAATGTESAPTITVGYATSSRANYRFGLYSDSETGYISNKNGNNGIRFKHRGNTVMQVGYGGDATTPYVGFSVAAPVATLDIAASALANGQAASKGIVKINGTDVGGAIHYDTYATLTSYNVENRFQLIAQDLGSDAGFFAFTNTPSSGTGANKHWIMGHRGPDMSNEFQIGYKTSTASGNISTTTLAQARLRIQTSGRVIVSDGGGVANGVFGQYAKLVVDTTEAHAQILATDTGSWGASFIMSMAPASGTNRHWWFHHCPATHGTTANSLIIRYAATNTAANIGGDGAGTTPAEFKTDGTVLFNAGNVGIGTTDPGQKLHVNGNMTVSGNITTNGSQLNFYRAVNSGNPEFHLGAAAGEALHIQSVYNSSTQVLNYVRFSTTTSSSTAHHGKFIFNVDGTGTDQLVINDTGIYAPRTGTLQRCADGYGCYV